MISIVINTDKDLTPAGKRKVRVGCYGRPVIHWYVSGRRYHKLPLTHENIKLSREWEAS